MTCVSAATAPTRLVGNQAGIEDEGGQPDDRTVADETGKTPPPAARMTRPRASPMMVDRRKPLDFRLGASMPAFHQAAAASSSTTPGSQKAAPPAKAGRHRADQRPGDDRAGDITEGQDGRDALDVGRVEAFGQDTRHRRPAAGLHQAVHGPEHEHRRQGRLKAEGQIHQRAGQQAEADDVKGADMTADFAPEEVAEGIGPEEHRAEDADFRAAYVELDCEQGQHDADIDAAKIEQAVGRA